MKAQVPKPTIIEEKRLRMGQVKRKTAQEINFDWKQTQERAIRNLRPILEL